MKLMMRETALRNKNQSNKRTRRINILCIRLSLILTRAQIGKEQEVNTWFELLFKLRIVISMEGPKALLLISTKYLRAIGGVPPT